VLKSLPGFNDTQTALFLGGDFDKLYASSLDGHVRVFQGETFRLVHDLSAVVTTKGRHSRDFGRLSIFDFFNSIGQERKPNRRRPASYLQAQVERDSLQAFGQRRATLTLNALRVLHGPYGLVSRRIFVAIPRRSTDVQVGVGSSGKHNPRSGVTHGSREPTLR
jgi:hypothetical protein